MLSALVEATYDWLKEIRDAHETNIGILIEDESDKGPALASLRAPINSEQTPYIKRSIREKIRRSGAVLCLVYTDTYTSTRGDWELETAIELKKPIVAVGVKGVSKVVLPDPIRARR
jgi:hypothetical protein